MAIFLETRQVTKKFGDLAAVKDLNFSIESGEIFGIAGPNGAGKTTLFNVITGFYRCTGEIYFEGKRIDRLRPHQVCQRGLARTFQIPSVFSSLSVYDNVRVAAHFGNVDRDTVKIITDVLDFVGLSERKEVQAVHLPLYEKKMTMLAAALATQPKVLMVDEPIGGLSPVEIAQSVEIFQRVNQELGITLIVIEHLMKVLLKLSHRLMILHNGQKISIGSPDEVINDKQVIDVYLGAEYA